MSRSRLLSIIIPAFLTFGFSTSAVYAEAAGTHTELSILQKNVAHQALIHKFYDAFARHDADTMASCYHPDIRFEDGAFGVLKGKDASDMWRMLLEQGKDLDVRHKYVQTQYLVGKGYVGSAHWDADYTFSLMGNKVNNKIDAKFTFKDGLIYTHTDHFDMQRWSSMAIGLPGVFFGGHPFFQQVLQKTARQRLKDFQSQE